MTTSLLLLMLLASAPDAAPLPPPRDGGLLAPGKAATDPLKGGEAVEHAFEAAEGQVIHLEIDVDQTTLTAELRAPDGRVAERLQSHDDAPPLVFASLATATGTWRVTTRLSPTDTGGTIRTLLEPPRRPGPLDLIRLEGQRLFNEAKARAEKPGEKGIEEALPLADRAAGLLGEAGDEPQQAWALFSASAGRYRLGQVKPSIAGFRRALAIFERLGDQFGLVQVLSALATSEASGAEFTEAVEHASRGLALAIRRGDPFVIAGLQHSLGFAYTNLRERDLAIDHFTEAIALWRQVLYAGRLANTLDLRGLNLSMAGDHAAARRDHEEARAIWKELGDRRGQAISLIYVAADLDYQGRPAEAEPLLREALGICAEAGYRLEEAAAASVLSSALLAQGKVEEPGRLAARMLAIFRSVGDLDGVANARDAEARVLVREGRLDEARASSLESVALTETLRLSAAGSGPSGAFTAARRRRYETLVDVLARLEEREPGRGHAGEALAVSEQAHARGLLQLLGEARTDLRQGVDAALLEQERAAGAALGAASERQARQAAAGKASDTERAAVEAQLQLATRDLEEAQARIRASSPRYAAVVQGGTLDQAGIQRELGTGTLLLEYLLGRDQSFLWAVGPDGVTIHRLERRERLEEATRRVHRCWAERCPAGEERRLAAEASRLLLGPVKERLRDRRLLVVADGALHYLPFAALTLPGRAERVVAAHQVVSLPSISTLAVLRQQVAGRSPAPWTLAVLADPVFEARDVRVRRAGPRLASAAPVAPGDALVRSSRDLGLGPLDRLRATRSEAEAIAALAPPGRSLVALDFGASRELATGGDLSRFRIVHFATHGLLDNRHPGLSGLVLSTVDEEGRSRNGFLRTSDVFGLELDADLVVLSACQTALGKEQQGEGLVGLSRAFMYAGAPRVLASLWMVPDGATAELMRRFYRALLGKGLAPAAALREAQRAMAAEPRWSNPYHWAGFTLQGLPE